MQWRWIILAPMIAFAGAVQAQAPSAIPMSVQELYRACQAGQGTRDSIICGQYISGVGDQLSLNGALRNTVTSESWQTVRRLAICGATNHTAMRRTFIAWARRHPEEWTKARAIGVVKALRETFPCAQ